MGVFEHFPYTNFHDLNLDWIVQELEKLDTDVRNFISINAIKYANPIQWDITNQYEKNTVVLDKDGNAYLSVQPVPAGVSLDRTEYWTNIGNFSALWESVKQAITIPDEGHETTASAPRAINDLVWVDGQLLEVTSPMIAGDQYNIGSNSRVYSMQIFLKETLSNFAVLNNRMDELSGKLDSAVNELKTEIDNSKFGNWIKGKKICVFGDSMSDTSVTANAWPTQLPDLLGCTVVNNSLSGRQMGGQTGFAGIVDNITEYGDINIVMLGINDFWNDRAVGTKKSTDIETFYGACLKVFSTIRKKNPTAINYYLPNFKTAFDDGGSFGEATFYYWIAWQCAKSNGFLYIDTNELIPGYCPTKTETSPYTDDKTHPNQAGQTLIAKCIAQALSTRRNDEFQARTWSMGRTVKYNQAFTQYANVQLDSNGNFTYSASAQGIPASAVQDYRLNFATLPDWLVAGVDQIVMVTYTTLEVKHKPVVSGTNVGVDIYGAVSNSFEYDIVYKAVIYPLILNNSMAY